MANPARTPDPRLDPTDPDRPPTDPLAPDPRLSPANSQTVNRFESRTGGTGILIAAVVVVLALIAYFAFAPGDDTTVAPDGSAVTETAPAPDATAPAAPSDTAPAPDATAPAAPSDSTAPAPSDSTAPAPDSTAPAPAPAPAQ
jgi:hypothetical protein